MGSIGRICGYKFTRQRLRDVMPQAEVNPMLWFAWDQGEPFAWTETKAELREAVKEHKREKES